MQLISNKTKLIIFVHTTVIIFQLVSPVHTKKFENDKNELDLALCMSEINVHVVPLHSQK